MEVFETKINALVADEIKRVIRLIGYHVDDLIIFLLHVTTLILNLELLEVYGQNC